MGWEGDALTDGTSGLVLVVDDDDDFREIAIRILQQAGYTTLGVAMGSDAIATARRDRPHLVVLDVRLGGALSGHEVCRVLKDELHPPPGILFVSGARTESFDRVGGLLVGGDDYIVKPFAADELLARVRALLRRSRAAAQGSAPLTMDELEVVRLLKDGLSPADIARKLDVSPTTTQHQIEQIFEKLGV
jgi:DNA-binding response OmpR family regulator